jgi:hypothetical protein
MAEVMGNRARYRIGLRYNYVLKTLLSSPLVTIIRSGDYRLAAPLLLCPGQSIHTLSPVELAARPPHVFIPVLPARLLLVGFDPSFSIIMNCSASDACVCSMCLRFLGCIELTTFWALSSSWPRPSLIDASASDKAMSPRELIHTRFKILERSKPANTTLTHFQGSIVHFSAVQKLCCWHEDVFYCRSCAHPLMPSTMTSVELMYCFSKVIYHSSQ